MKSMISLTFKVMMATAVEQEVARRAPILPRLAVIKVLPGAKSTTRIDPDLLMQFICNSTWQIASAELLDAPPLSRLGSGPSAAAN